MTVGKRTELCSDLHRVTGCFNGRRKELGAGESRAQVSDYPGSVSVDVIRSAVSVSWQSRK